MTHLAGYQRGRGAARDRGGGALWRRVCLGRGVLSAPEAPVWSGSRVPLGRTWGRRRLPNGGHRGGGGAFACGPPPELPRARRPAPRGGGLGVFGPGFWPPGGWGGGFGAGDPGASPGRA